MPDSCCNMYRRTLYFQPFSVHVTQFCRTKEAKASSGTRKLISTAFSFLGSYSFPFYFQPKYHLSQYFLDLVYVKAKETPFLKISFFLSFLKVSFYLHRKVFCEAGVRKNWLKSLAAPGLFCSRLHILLVLAAVGVEHWVRSSKANE